MKVKKIKLEAMSSYHSNANHHGADGENGDLSSSVGEDALHAHCHKHKHIRTHLNRRQMPTAKYFMCLYSHTHTSTAMLNIF